MRRTPSQVAESDDQAKQTSLRAANLIYGVADSVPVPSLLPLVAQQVIMLSVDFISGGDYWTDRYADGDYFYHLCLAKFHRT